MKRSLERIVASRTFEKSGRARDLLAYLVKQELSGGGAALKGFSIAVDVFGKDESFDAGNDPLVRVHAGRLRELLDSYYAEEGAGDDVRIRIPRGSYRPKFDKRKSAMTNPGDRDEKPADTSMSAPDGHDGASGYSGRGRLFFGILLATLIALGAYFAIFRSTWMPASDPERLAQEQIARNSLLPVVRVRADLGDPELVAFSEQLVSALAAFDTVTTLKLADSGAEGPEYREASPLDYSLAISRSSLKDGNVAVVKVELGSMNPEKVLRAEEHRMDIWNDADARVLIARKITGIAAPEGVIYADIAAKGELNPLLDCLILVRAYYHASNAASHSPAYECSKELAGKAEAGGLIMATHAGLMAEAVGKGFDLDDLPEDRDAALRTALNLALKGVDKAPVSARSAREVGFVYSWQGAFGAMRDWFERAYDLNPNDTSIAASHGYGLFLTGEFESSVEVFSKAIEAMTRHPAWWDLYYSLGLLMIDRVDEAKEAIKPVGLKKRGLFYIMLNAVYAHRQDDRFRAAYLVRELKERYPKFAADPEASFEKRHYPPELVNILVDSLRQSGL